MNKLIILFIAFTLVLGGCDIRNKDKQAALAAASKNISTKNPPTTVQLIDSAYDFGRVTDGEVVEYSYRFKNSGNMPLIIETATASCGCTVPEKPEKPVLPGEIGFIKVKFNSEHRVGKAHKTINVTSNANPAFPTLDLRGEVVAKPESE